MRWEGSTHRQVDLMTGHDDTRAAVDRQLWLVTFTLPLRSDLITPADIFFLSSVLPSFYIWMSVRKEQTRREL